MKKKVNLSESKSLAFKRGQTVLFTDPCYIISYELGEEIDKAWQDMCDEMFSEEGVARGLDKSGTMEFEGVKILYTKTTYGDGVYNVKSFTDDVKGRGVGVDAGLICAVPLDDALKINPNLAYDRLAEYVKLSDDEELYVANNAIQSKSGNISLTTDDYDE